jgi:hypothetical protein
VLHCTAQQQHMYMDAVAYGCIRMLRQHLQDAGSTAAATGTLQLCAVLTVQIATDASSWYQHALLAVQAALQLLNTVCLPVCLPPFYTFADCVIQPFTSGVFPSAPCKTWRSPPPSKPRSARLNSGLAPGIQAAVVAGLLQCFW